MAREFDLLLPVAPLVRPRLSAASLSHPGLT